MKLQGKFFVVLMAMCIKLFSCQQNPSSPKSTPEPEPGPDAPKSTWEVIQTKILDAACIDCHAAGTSFARQSNLILTADVAYDQLVNHPPENTAAAGDGLIRVGTKGLASVEKSFLWEKINAPDQEHFYTDHPRYGGLMPLGKPSLTNGELEYILKWILAGAPDTGHVADEALLLNTTRYEPPEFKALEPPPSGIQLHVGPFDVAPNYEKEFFYYEPLNNSEDIFVNRFEISMRPGSHHFILYKLAAGVPDELLPQPRVFRDFRDASGRYITENFAVNEFQQFVSGTQSPYMNYQLPPGVAMRLPANARLDLDSHYVNRSDKSFQGEVYTNLYTVDRSEVQHVADIWFLSNEDFSLPPNQVTTVTKIYPTARKIHIFQLLSHAHEHMVEFRVYISGGPRNGELVYIAYDWEHPPILELNPPIVLERGHGLKLEVTYNNWTNRTLRWGLLSVDEMMILAAHYYTD